MSKPKYRVIAKVLCPNCQSQRQLKKRFDLRCPNCIFVRYTARNGLLKFTAFLNKSHPNWVYMNVFEYVKADKGRLLESYQQGKNEPQKAFI